MHDVIIAKPERPFLTARWSELAILSFAVPLEAVARIAPAGTVPDLFEGQAFISIVGFWFRETRVVGAAIPGHTLFQEVNLRYYVRREVNGEVRRGVVFAQEIVPRRAVALAANWLYHESYVARPMASDIRMASEALSTGDTIEYRWQTGRRAAARWNRIGGRVSDELCFPIPGSIEEFIVEHYWGYSRGGPRGTCEYRVEHVPWRVAALDDVVWDCDLAANYATTPFTRYLTAPPASALIANGSRIQIFPGRRVATI